MKRKFKIIFAIVAVMAMLFAFAIVSSAEGLVFEDGFDGSSELQYYVVDIPWDSSSIIAIISDYDEIVAIDPLIFQEFCSGEGIKNYDDFYAYFEAEVQQYGDSEPDIFYSSMLGLSSDEFNYYYNYNVIDESDLNEKYQEGKESGVEEYKNSTEYKLELLEEVKKVTGGESEGVEIFYDFSSEDDWYFSSFDSVNEINIPYGDNKNLYFASFCAQKCGFVVDSSALRDFCSFVELEYFYAENLDDLKYPEIANTYIGPFENFKQCDIDDLFLEALNYSEFTSDSLDAKYNEGVEAGRAEGKTEGYTEGFAEGMESFKESEAYANALQVQYATGKTDGVTEFKKSVAFKNTLKGEYDNGYDAGVADTEGQAVKNEFTKVLSIFIGVMGFGIILMSVFGVASKFKKKSKRR